MASSIKESDFDSFVAPHQELEIDKLFRACVKLQASDLHLKVGKPPMVRVNGTLRPMSRGPIDDEEMVRLCFPMMNERNRKIFDHDGGADFAHMIDVEGTKPTSEDVAARIGYDPLDTAPLVAELEAR